MDRVTTYKNIVEKEMRKRADIKSSYMTKVENQLIINQDRTHFVLLSVGWHEKHYVHGITFNVEIRNDKVWVHEDMTDVDIAWRLIDAGIPQSDIVLGFVPEYARGEGFAVA